MGTGRAFADQSFEVLLLGGRGLFREVLLEGDGFAAQLSTVDFALTAAAEKRFDRAGVDRSGLNRGTELQKLVHGKSVIEFKNRMREPRTSPSPISLTRPANCGGGVRFLPELTEIKGLDEVNDRSRPGQDVVQPRIKHPPDPASPKSTPP